MQKEEDCGMHSETHKHTYKVGKREREREE